MKATWNRQVIAESDRTLVVENNHYFPPDAVHDEYLQASSRRTTCPWKGEARYYDLVVEGKRNRNAAWSYAEPKEAAKEIAGYVAFWKGVEIAE